MRERRKTDFQQKYRSMFVFVKKKKRRGFVKTKWR